MRDLKSVIFPFLTNITDKCILYPFLRKDGYGDIQYWNEEGKKRHYLAHRLSYEVYNNISLKTEQLVLHSCDVPNCVNPRHLRIGTHKDNASDRVFRDRCAKGVKSGNYKHGLYSKFASTKVQKEFNELYGRSLDKIKVLAIKDALKKRGNKTLKQLSEEFDISYRVLIDIKRERSYKNL